MILRILCIFLILLFSVYLGIQIHQTPGYVLIVANHWTLETTLWVAVFALIFVVFAFHIALQISKKIVHIPSAWKNWRAHRRAHKAQMETKQGLIEFSEGHWKSAKKHLIKALPDADTPLLNYLTAARAAQEMGEHALRDDYLREAQQSMPEAKIAIELTQAQLQIANHQWEQSLATLRHLQDLAPHHPYVLKLLAQLYQEVGDWQQLIELLPQLKRYHVLPADEFSKTQQHAYAEALRLCIKQHNQTAAHELMSSLPKELRYDNELIKIYAQNLMTHHQDKEAESQLRLTLQKKPQEDLLELYAQLDPTVIRLNFIESLLKTSPHDPVLHFCLGKLYVNKQLWGKAQNHFEESIQLKSSWQAYLELGKLLEQLNEDKAALRAYRRGLEAIHSDEL